jgi:hypothetical protein
MCSFQKKVFLKKLARIKTTYYNSLSDKEKEKVSKKQEVLCKVFETFSKKFFI